MLKIKIEARAKCRRHPGYDPEKDGLAGIRGGCIHCEVILALYDAALDFEQLTALVLAARAAIVVSNRRQTNPSNRYAAEPESPIAGSAHFRYRE